MSKKWSKSKPKLVLGIMMEPGVKKATQSVVGMIFDPLKLSIHRIATVERFMFVAKAVTCLQVSDTFEIAVVELRNWLRSLTPGQRLLLTRNFDRAVLEGMPEAPATAQKPKKVYKPDVRVLPFKGSQPTVGVKTEFYASWEWRTLRMEALKEFGRACQCCGAGPGMKAADGTPVRICVDHIKPISKFWELRLDRSNLQILCDECNQGKGNWDQTDFRPAPVADEWVIEDAGIDPLLLAQLGGLQ